MRALAGLLAIGGLVACSGNDVEPRLIPGGGIGDGDIDGEVNVYVIDNQTDAPIAGAQVTIKDTTKATDAKGLAVFDDVSGKQTISVAMAAYRNAVWVDANGANVTIPIKADTGTPAQATLAGTIAGWSSVTVPSTHIKGAIVIYSQSDDLGDAANNLSTPNMANICGGNGPECSWSVVTRAGMVTLLAAIVDRDPKGTLDPGDDVTTVIGYASKTGIVVNDGISQSGLVLDLVEAGNLDTVTIDQGTPPAGLPQLVALAGIEIADSEILQNPFFALLNVTSLLMPKRTLFGADATYRLTAIAQTTSGDAMAQSIVLRSGLTDPALAAGTWLTPPVNVAITRTTASWDLVTGASTYSVTWKDTTRELLEITVFDAKTTSVEVPNVVALPTSGTFTARVNAIGSDFDLNDFSLEADSDLLWGIAAQPVTIP